MSVYSSETQKKGKKQKGKMATRLEAIHNEKKRAEKLCTLQLSHSPRTMRIESAKEKLANLKLFLFSLARHYSTVRTPLKVKKVIFLFSKKKYIPKKYISLYMISIEMFHGF